MPGSLDEKEGLRKVAPLAGVRSAARSPKGRHNPAYHKTHAAAELAPGSAVYDPHGHVSQVETLVAPTAVEYVASGLGGVG